MKNKLLSIIIPTYNCRTYLKEAVDSVLCSLRDDMELIVVDDGSTDGTAELLEGYKGNSSIGIFLREHEGVSKTRNYGMEKSSGTYIGFLDCDDVLKEDFLKESLPLLKEDLDLYIFGFEHVEKNGRRAKANLFDRDFLSVSDFADEYIRNRHLLIYSACNKFYKRRIIRENSIFFQPGLDFGEDRLFNYDYLKHAKNVRTSSLIMFDYMHRSDNSASKRDIPNQYETITKLHEAKMDCFFGLAKAVSDEEKISFMYYDLTTEINRMSGGD